MMLEDFEKGDDVKAFLRIPLDETFEAESMNPGVTAEMRGEASRFGVQFHSGDGVTRIPSSGEEIAGAAARVEQSAGARGAGIAQKVKVAGLEREKADVAVRKHAGAFLRTGHGARLPKMEAARGAGVKPVGVKGLQVFGGGGGAAGGAS